MDSFRGNQWQENSEVYTEEQVGAVLRECGVNVQYDTYTHLICFCPFHGNTDTPAFAVDKSSGLYYCFSPSCGEFGTLPELVRKTTGLNEFKAQRIIIKNRKATEAFAKTFASVISGQDDMPSVKQETLDRLYEEFNNSDKAKEYMASRGFDESTLSFFKIGYSPKKDLVCVPMHDIDGKPIGFIGRVPSHTEKRFKNSVNLPKARTCWNIHRAKRTGNIVIICEASFDAMRVHQAGFPNVVALLGGSLTDSHIKQLGRYFETVIIMTDWDKREVKPVCRKCERDNLKECKGHRPGRDLGHQIAEAFKLKKVFWACYSDEEVFPNWVKDAGMMTDDQIRQCIYGAKTNYEYVTTNIENLAPDA